MKVELASIFYMKNGEVKLGLDPDSDMTLLLHVKTRRNVRLVAYNANTKEIFEYNSPFGWYPGMNVARLANNIGKRIYLDNESLEVFDATLAVFLSEKPRSFYKKHMITVSPTVTSPAV